MAGLPAEDWEDIKLIDILPTEIWLLILRCLMPGEAHLHVKWSSPNHKTLSHIKCFSNEDKTFIRDMCSFGQTCKEALKMRDLIFHEQLCLHFGSEDVFRKFIEIHPRFTIGKNQKSHQSFKEIHLALRKIDDSTFKKRHKRVAPLHGVSLLKVYLLQPPGKKVLNTEFIHELKKILRNRAKIIRIETFIGIPSINLAVNVNTRSDIDTISFRKVGLLLQELGEMEKKSGGYAYGYPHESCDVYWALEELKKVDSNIRVIRWS